jgi:hypothetical protein
MSVMCSLSAEEKQALAAQGYTDIEIFTWGFVVTNPETQARLIKDPNGWNEEWK